MKHTTLLEAYRNAYKKHFEWVARLNEDNYRYLETLLVQSEQHVLEALLSSEPTTTFAELRKSINLNNPTIKIVYDFAAEYITNHKEG